MSTTSGRRHGRTALVVALADVVVPVGLYYLCRGIGLSELHALLVSAVAPVVSLGVQGVVVRRVDAVAVFVGAVLALNVGVALTAADPRTLLARDGWITGLAGGFFLLTLGTRRPIVFSIVRPLGEGRLGPRDEDWDSLWDRLPPFRRVWRVLTAIWGTGLLVDAAVRIVLAYSLPVDVVPASNGIQYAVVYLLLQAASQVYFRRSGLMALPEFAGSRRRRRS
jgi:hypothetical protein